MEGQSCNAAWGDGTPLACAAAATLLWQSSHTVSASGYA